MVVITLQNLSEEFVDAMHHMSEYAAAADRTQLQINNSGRPNQKPLEIFSKITTTPTSTPPTKQQHQISAYHLTTEELIGELKRSTGDTFEWEFVDDTLYTARHKAKLLPLFKIMVVAGMHAREPITTEVARMWMMYTMLFANSTARSSITEWLYVPVANPCGRDLVARAKPNSWTLCKRTNCKGVDLNRNWMTHNEHLYGFSRQPWDKSVAEKVWAGRPEDNPGPHALSEPEVLTLRSILLEYKPDMLISLHSGTLAVMTPPDDQVAPAPLKAIELNRLARWVASHSCSELCKKRVKPGTEASGYSAAGTMTDYAFYRARVPAVLTLEVHGGTEPINGTSPPDYGGTENYGPDPMSCFRFFNPPEEKLLDALRPWVGLWDALYNVNDNGKLFEIMIELRNVTSW